MPHLPTRYIAVLRATGSIGLSSLDVRGAPPRSAAAGPWNAGVLAAGSEAGLVRQCRRQGPLGDCRRGIADAAARAGLDTRAPAGGEAIEALAGQQPSRRHRSNGAQRGQPSRRLAFLQHGVAFLSIPAPVEATLEAPPVGAAESLAVLRQADTAVRRMTEAAIPHFSPRAGRMSIDHE